MDLMSMLGGGITPDKIGEILSDSEKVKEYLPILATLADSFKTEDEHSIGAYISFEEGNPILRIVATKLVDIEVDGKPVQHLVVSRNVDNAQGEPIKFNLLELMASNNEQEEKEEGQ